MAPLPTDPSPPARVPGLLPFAALGLVLLAARLLGAHYSTFFQHDEVSLAVGVAALMRGSIADVYHFGPQAGYYSLVEVLTTLFGGDLRVVPGIMTTLSALAATVIPLCGLAILPDRLTRTEQWALAGVLAVHPTLWMSGTYGNSAMPSAALMMGGLTVLSRRPGRVLEAAGLGLCAAAILVRADAVLATPAVALLLYDRHGAVRPALLRAAALAGALAAVYAVLLVTDAHMMDAVRAVTGHLTNQAFATHFWDYLLWSTSPFLLAGAVLGAGELLARRRRLLALVIAWCLPFFVFYFGSTTNPRYFVPTAVPVAVCTAVGLVALPGLLAPTRLRLAAWATALVAGAHLFVGLGHFAPGSPMNLVRQAQFETQIGPFWTGALLYKTYLAPEFLARSVRHPGFGRGNGTQRVTDDALAEVASGADSGRTIAVLLGGWNGHAFHYYAHVHGARYVSKRSGPLFVTETWLTLGGARLMSVRRSAADYDAMTRLPVSPGDQVWVFAYDATSLAGVRGRLAPGLSLAAVGDTTAPVRRFLVARATP